MNLDDDKLLAQYAADDAEAAFKALTERYVNLVYSAALRQVRDPSLAEEVTQVVFILLARKAGTFRQGVVLSGWLLRATRFTATNVLVSQYRRLRREQAAVQMQAMSNDEPTWESVAPLLDEAVACLSEGDRDLIALRFFDQKSFKEVGAALGIEEDAAQKRATRALEKLRKFFAKRGVVLSGLALAAMLPANAVHAAPSGIAAGAAAAAVSKGAAAVPSTVTLLKTILKIMAWTKLKTAIVTVVVIAAAGLTTTVVVKNAQSHKTYDWEVVPVSGEILFKTSPQVTIVPSKTPSGPPGSASAGDSWIGMNLSAEYIMRWLNGWGSSVRMIRNAQFPPGNFDFISNLPKGSPAALGELYTKKFSLVARRETRDTNVLALRVKTTNAPGLKPGNARSGWSNGTGAFTYPGETVGDLATFLEENYFRIPIVNETGITGSFNFELKWAEPGPTTDLDKLKQALLDQFGFELVPDHQSIEMLVVDKAR